MDPSLTMTPKQEQEFMIAMNSLNGMGDRFLAIANPGLSAVGIVIKALVSANPDEFTAFINLSVDVAKRVKSEEPGALAEDLFSHFRPGGKR
jgi:hypothetical protein